MTTSARTLLQAVVSGVVGRRSPCCRRSFSSTSFGFASLEHEYSVVSHTPIFSQLVSKLMLMSPSSGGRQKLILDMTFGSGGHANLLLDHKADLVDRLVVCDCDRAAYSEAKELKARRPDKVVPLRSRFANLPNLLLDNGFTPGCFDGILIDTGCSTHQWADTARGFCPNKAGPLDLRYDPQDHATPTGSEVLQNINDRDLGRMLKAYSGMGPNMCKYVANSIIEARYLFHKFLTTDELRDVLTSAAMTYVNDKASRSDFHQRSTGNESVHLLDEDEVSRQMMKATLTALQLCVNNDVNELHFAINSVARNFLKPESGILVAIVNSVAESRVTQSSLVEASAAANDSALDISASGSKSWLPWRLVHDQPQELTTAEKTLYPRLQHAKLYAASLVA